MTSTRSPHIIAVRAQTILLASVVSLWSMPAFAQTRPERMSDKDVKTLIDQVDDGRDKFEGNLDGAVQGRRRCEDRAAARPRSPAPSRTIRTTPRSSRIDSPPDYSASAEVATVLKQSTAIDAFMQGAPSAMKGRSEWDQQTTNLKRLAESYGTTFPLPDGATPRRVNDKETAGHATAIATSADRFKNDLDKDKTLAKPEKDAAKKDVELLVKQADAVKSRTSDGNPATGEVRQLGRTGGQGSDVCRRAPDPHHDELGGRADLAR